MKFLSLFSWDVHHPPLYYHLWRPEMKEKELTEGNARQAFEYLKLINDASSEEEQIRLLKKWGDKPPLNLLLSLNFNPKIELDLPSGMPPPETYKRDETTHPDFFTPMAGQIQRLMGCKKPAIIKKQMDRERVFLQVLEHIGPKEADVLCAAKDKSLKESYPKITAELIAKVFPNYV